MQTAAKDSNRTDPIVNPVCILYLILLVVFELYMPTDEILGAGMSYGIALAMAFGGSLILLSRNERPYADTGRIIVRVIMYIQSGLFGFFLFIITLWTHSVLETFLEVVVSIALVTLGIGYYLFSRRFWILRYDRSMISDFLLFSLVAIMIIGCVVHYAAPPRLSASSIPKGVNGYIKKEIEALFSMSPNNRVAAAGMLAHCPSYSVPAIPFLLSMLNDDASVSCGADSLCRTTPGQKAARALGAVGEPSLELLLAILENKDLSPLLAPFFPDRESAPPIDLETGNGVVRVNVVEALASMASLMDSRVNNALLGALKDREAAVRKAAVRKMTSLYKDTQDPRIPNALGGVLSDEDPDVRGTATAALLSMHDPRSRDLLLDALDSGYPDVRERAGKGMRDIAFGLEGKDYGSDPALLRSWWDEEKEKQVKHLIKDDNGGGSFASYVLRDVQDPFSLDELACVLLNGDSPARRGAAWMLGKIGNPGALVPLLRALEDEDRRVVREAMDALGELKDPRAVPSLIEFVRRRKLEYGRRAEMALSKISGRTLLLDPGRWDAWWKADQMELLAERVQYIRGHADELVSLLADKDWSARERARQALLSIGEPAADALIRALGAGDPSVRSDVANLLAWCKDFRAAGPLIESLGRKHDLLRDAQIHALSTIVGELSPAPYGGGAEGWREWWRKNKEILPDTPARPSGRRSSAPAS